MRIDNVELGRLYESMSDEELLSVDRDELTENARIIYDLELAGRKLKKDTVDEKYAAVFKQTGGVVADADSAPEWLQDATVICSFPAVRGNSAAEDAAQAQATLLAAGIPSCIQTVRNADDDDQPSDYETLNVMAPVGFALHAGSILDRDFFNEKYEAEFRVQLCVLSDQDLLKLDPDILCAGLLDRAARIKKVYKEEVAERTLKR
jgi:hypothetical protein